MKTLLTKVFNLENFNSTQKMSNGNKAKNLSWPSLLLVIFIILKLTKIIDWSWLWILSPLWIGVALGILFFIVIGLILLATVIGMMRKDSKVVITIKNMFRRQNQESQDLN